MIRKKRQWSWANSPTGTFKTRGMALNAAFAFQEGALQRRLKRPVQFRSEAAPAQGMRWLTCVDSISHLRPELQWTHEKFVFKKLTWKLYIIDLTEETALLMAPFCCTILTSLPYFYINFPGIQSGTRLLPASRQNNWTECGCGTTLTKWEDTRAS